MNSMLEAVEGNHPYFTGSVYADGSEETIFYCPECAKDGGENKLLYAVEIRELVCSCCPAQFADEAEVQRQFLLAAFQLQDELADAKADSAQYRCKLAAIREVAA